MPILPLFSGFPYLPFPLAPPPVVTNVEGVGTSGGSSQCNGMHFVATPTASVNINGTPTTLTVTFNSANQIILTLASGTYMAGSWNLTITNPDGQQSITVGSFTITSVSTPETIMGAAMVFDLDPSAATVSGSNIVSVPDITGNGNNATMVSSNAPQQVLGDSRFLMSPTTMQFTAANSEYLAIPSVALGSGGTLYLWLVCDSLDTGTLTYLLDYDDTDRTALVTSTSNQFESGWSSTTATVTAPLSTAGPATLLSGTNHSVGTSLNVNNGTEVDGSASLAVANNSAQLTIAARNNSGTYVDYANLVVARVCGFNTKPTSTQSLQLATYANNKFGVTTPPNITFATQVPASTSGAALRITGSGFMPGVTLSLIVAGSPVACTGISSTTTTADFTTPSIAAGTYDAVVANSDGRSRTILGAVTVIAANANLTVAAMNRFGLSVVGLYTPGNFSLSGSAVTSWNDQSGLSQNAIQATGANQPTYTPPASDTIFAPSGHGVGYITGNGTSSCLECSSFLFNGGVSCSLLSVVAANGSSANIQTTAAIRSTPFNILYFTATSTEPECTSAVSSTWGSAPTGAQNIDGLVTQGSGTSGVVSINVANSGSPVTTNGNIASFTDGSPLYILSDTTFGFAQQHVCALVVLNATPNGTALSGWHSDCQALAGTT